MTDDRKNLIPSDRPRREQEKSFAPRSWLIAEREIITNLKNRKVLIAFVSLTVLSLFSARIMVFDHKGRVENWAAAQARQRDPIVGGSVRFEMADGEFMHRAGIGRQAPIQPPQPLSVLVKGIDGEMDRSVTVNQRIVFGPIHDEPTMGGLFDAPDVFFIFKVLLSFLALMFSLDINLNRKEGGSLRAILSLPVRRRALFFYKSLGAAMSLLAPFTLAYLIMLAYLRLTYDALGGAQEICRALMIYGMGALYAIDFILIGFYLSTMKLRVELKVTTALLAWAAIVLVLPNASALTAKLLSPAQSYNQLNARLYETRQRMLEEQTPSSAGPSQEVDAAISIQRMRRVIENDRRLTDQFLDGKKEQARRAQQLASLSPAGALAFGLSDLAGTGLGAYFSYLDLCRANRDLMNEALDRRLSLPAPAGERLVQQTREKIAASQRQTEPMAKSLRAASLGMISLLVWAAGFGLASYWRFERFDVR